MASKPLRPVTGGRPAETLSRGVWRVGSDTSDPLDPADLAQLGPTALRRLLRRTLRQADATQRSYRSLLDAVPDAVTVFDRRGRVVEANAAACASFGLTRDELRGMTLFDLNPDLPPDHMRHVWGRLQLGQTFSDRVFNLRADGTRFPADVHSNAYLERGRGRIVAVARDISALIAAEQKLHERATRDGLTALPNRQTMLDALDEAVERGEAFALLSIDLDRFKVVNDALGHAAGDRLLIAAAQRLRRCCRNSELLARFGGDEFLIAMRLPQDPALGEQAIARLTTRLTRAFARPFRLARQEFSVTVSIGVARWPDDGHRVNNLIGHADAALYDAKQRGRNQWRRFDAALAASLRNRIVIDTELRHALDRDEMQLYFQPKVELREGKLVGAEALLRWNNRLLGVTGPAHFIPHAETNGEILRLGAWVLDRACAQWREWDSRGLKLDRMSVNVSFRQLMTGDFAASVGRALDKYAMPGEALEIEITEHALIEDVPEIAAAFATLKLLGVKLVIDDFGEGYAGLNVLRRLPFDGLKIGHQFMQGVPGNDADRSVCEAILHIAKSLGLTVVAEGIETPQQRDFMQRLGADWAQGFYFGRPVDANAFFLSHRSTCA